MENTDYYCNKDKKAVRLSCRDYDTPNCSRDCFYAKSIESTQNTIERMKNKTERLNNAIQNRL